MTSLSSQHKFLILATDGVWDYLTDDDAVQLVSKCEDKSQAASLLVETALVIAAKESNLSIEKLKSLPPGRERRCRHDDTTAMVMFLHDD